MLQIQVRRLSLKFEITKKEAFLASRSLVWTTAEIYNTITITPNLFCKESECDMNFVSVKQNVAI